MLIILYSFRAFIGMKREGFFKRWRGVGLFGIYTVYPVLQYGLKIGGTSG